MNRLLKDLEFKVYTTPLEKAGSSGERRLIRGYASVGDVLDRQNEVITLGALMKAKEDLLKNHTIFYEHKHSELPIGKTIAVDIDEKGLLITVELSKGSHADSVWTLIQEGILNSFSIGGRVLEAEEKRDPKTGDLFNEITRIELFETSVVGLPANPAAKFELISKSFGMAITEELRKKREVSNMAKETKKEVKVEVKKIDVEVKEVGNALSPLVIANVDSSNDSAEFIVTKSEVEEVKVETEKSEEGTEEKKEVKEKIVEKTDETTEKEEVKEKEMVSEEKEIEKIVEEKSFHGDLPEDKIQMVANAVASISEASNIEASLIWSALSTIHVDTTDNEKSEKVEEKYKETSEETNSLKENSSEEKSIDEQILEKLGQILENQEKKKTKKSEESKEEVETLKEEKSEEVKETVTTKSEDKVEITKSTETTEKSEESTEEKEESTEEKDIKKVVKIEDTPKEEKSKEKEIPSRKGEVIIAETPYASSEEEKEVSKVILQKMRDEAWKNIVFGKKQ